MSGGVRYIDAVRSVLDAEMASDPSVVVLGLDVSSGGPFGATAGLAERHGRGRVRDTPISENAVAGLATGAALTGRRPVVEIMFIDFATLAMDQLVNHAAKLHYMSGGQLRVPLTVRVQAGAAGGYGAHHSQSLESWFTHVPGLKVVAPSTPADVTELLGWAIRSDDPVIVVEHRALYWTRGPSRRTNSPGGAGDPGSRFRRTGDDLTVVSWSHMVSSCLAAADLVESEGIRPEIIDLRSLSPLDMEPVFESVRRTGRLLIASEAVESGGLGAEVAARVASHDIALRSLIARCGAPFAPVPAATNLEAAFVPSPDDLAAAMRELGMERTAT